MAWLDLCTQGAGVRLAQFLGDVARERVPVNATLDERDPERAATAARDYAARGFRCIKLKIAPHDVEGEVARLCAIRAVVGDALQIRADANGGWTVEQALAALPLLAVYGLEYVEQPVADIAGLAAVRRASDVSVAADESVTDVASVEAIAAARAADIIVIKPTLLGPRGAAEVAHVARRCGLDVVITSLLDTSIGISAAVHLAATLPDPLRACGLATATLLAGDLVSEPPTVVDGCLPVPRGPGLGVELADAALARWRDRAGT
jgi:o-succinylbenzoate synthase